MNNIESFKNAMRDAGLTPPDHIPTGKIIAFPAIGKPRSNKSARCFLFDDGKGGFFQDFTTGLYRTWQAERDGKPYTQAERQAFREQCEKARLAREQELAQTRQQVAQKAREMWKRAVYAQGFLSLLPYLSRKRIQPHGAKTGDSGGLKGVLILPLYNSNLKLVNLQFIDGNGGKKFLTGGQKSGCFWWLGQKTPTVLIAESFSTSASLHEQTGNQVFISYGKDNLEAIARIVRTNNPDAEIIIMGDNDPHGVGQEAARKAALACGGRYLIPDVIGFDWNDIVNANLKVML